MGDSSELTRDVLLDAFEAFKEDSREEEYDPELVETMELMSRALKMAREKGFYINDNYAEIVEMFKYRNSKGIDGLLDHILSDIYAVELISLIPEVSRRSIKLRSIIATKRIEDTAGRYIEEASRCFIYGFYMASAILCRAAIEDLLKRRLEVKNITYLDDNLKGLINLAFDRKHINKDEKDILEEIRRKGNACVHGRKSFTENDAEDMINKTRRMVEKLLVK